MVVWTDEQREKAKTEHPLGVMRDCPKCMAIYKKQNLVERKAREHQASAARKYLARLQDYLQLSEADGSMRLQVSVEVAKLLQDPDFHIDGPMLGRPVERRNYPKMIGGEAQVLDTLKLSNGDVKTIRKDWVYSILNDFVGYQSGVTSRKVATWLGISPILAAAQLRWLVEYNLMRRKGRKYYVLTTSLMETLKRNHPKFAVTGDILVIEDDHNPWDAAEMRRAGLLH